MNVGVSHIILMTQEKEKFAEGRNDDITHDPFVVMKKKLLWSSWLVWRLCKGLAKNTAVLHKIIKQNRSHLLQFEFKSYHLS